MADIINEEETKIVNKEQEKRLCCLCQTHQRQQCFESLLVCEQCFDEHRPKISILKYFLVGLLFFVLDFVSLIKKVKGDLNLIPKFGDVNYYNWTFCGIGTSLLSLFSLFLFHCIYSSYIKQKRKAWDIKYASQKKT